MQLSPFELALDNSAAKGEAGFIFGNPVKSMIVLNIDSANFDNYIEKLPQIDADKICCSAFRPGLSSWRR